VNRKLIVAACLAVTATFAPLGAASAAAVGGGAISVPAPANITEFSSDQVDAAVAADAGTAQAQQVQQDFLDEQARSGVLWDSNEVSAATLDASTDIAFSNNVDTNQVQTAVPEDDAAAEVAIDANMAGDGDGAAADTSLVGSSALEKVAGQVAGSYSGGAVTVQVDGDHLTSAWERYKIKETKTDRDIYYYGHWVTATGKTIGGATPDHYPGAIDIRSRPKTGRRGDFLQMRDYWPKTSGAHCDTSSVGIGILGFSATLPLGNCDGFTPDPDASNILMKNTWSDGACRDSRAEYLDLGMAVDVKPTVSTAVLSDYSYARFETAICDQDASNDPRVIYADPGWS